MHLTDPATYRGIRPRRFRSTVSRLIAAVALGATVVPAQTAADAALQVNAVAVASPPSITFSWPNSASATSYTVARRSPGATAWGSATVVPGGGAATSWTDTNVVVGARYQYRFIKVGGPSARGIVTAGAEAAPIEDRGKLILVVDATKAQVLAARIDRLTEDLIGDGWQVLRHDVQPTQSVTSVKALIVADYNADPSNVRAVFLLGHVPVPYSGNINPDGHSNHRGAWPADVYYGDVDGIWTDGSINNTSASRSQNHNVPGDGKFDQSSIPSNADLDVGRVDLANMPAFGLSEEALLQNYLDKDHDFRHKVFSVDQRAVIDDNFGWFSGEAFAATGWRNFSAIVGRQNVAAGDYFTTLNTTSGNGYAWSYGCGGGSYTSAGGIGNTTSFTTSTNRNVFTILFGSYFGDWDSTNNFLRAPLCSGWTLSNAWAGRPHWSFHPMCLGETIGASARLSQNDTTAGGFGTRWVHVALMGDPTLRQHIIAPPSNVAVVGPGATVSWNPSADPVAGYHVYRARAAAGPFSRVTTSAIVGTSFVDPSPLIGHATYMVRALRLETVPTGSYWNLSQGAFGSTCLPNVLATHTSYGNGCYAISDSFYQYFANPAAASTALNGSSITLTPVAGGYTVAHGGGTYAAPGPAASVLSLGDNDQTTITPSAPVPYPGGTATALTVHSNGMVGTAPFTMPSLPNSATPTPQDFLNEASAAWYSWHDYDPTEVGSGSIKAEEVAGVLYVTWEGVESHPHTTANPSTLQFQFELSTGVVRLVWASLASVGTGQSTSPSEQHLIGWSPGGFSVDAGSIDLATALPLTVGSRNVAAITLSASPAPISTPTSGTLVTYTITDVPESAPGSGSYTGFTIISLAPDLAGTSLAPFGMPDCSFYVGRLDLLLPFSGSSSTLVTQFQIPAGVACGQPLYATAAAFMQPGSLPNGQNAAGVVTSNGVKSIISTH